VQNNNAVALGGGIAHTIATANSDLTLNETAVRDNEVTESIPGVASGGGIYFVGADPTQVSSIAQGTEVIGNKATGDDASGAGIFAVRNAGTFTISQSTVSFNTTTVEPDGDAPDFEGGGGITLTGPTASTVSETTVEGNTVTVQDLDDGAVGGGIRDDGTLTIDKSLLVNNTVQGGSAMDQNLSQRGAGLYAVAPLGPTNVINSTFSGNTSVVGGIGGSQGGGIRGHTATQPLVIVHSTFSENAAQFGEAINVSGGSFGTNLTVRGSLFDEDGVLGCFPSGLNNDPNGYNVDSGESCVGSTADTDARNATSGGVDLGPLGPNSGFTRTYSLGAGSVAIDFVPTAQCLDLLGDPLTEDQRGFPRPEGLGCEAGSFEVTDTDDDNDGVLDVNDNCPLQAGVAANAGCPATATPVTPTTFNLAAAIKKCKKKFRKGTKARKKCIRKARARAKAG
jgi:hypothetical protein